MIDNYIHYVFAFEFNHVGFINNVFRIVRVKSDIQLRIINKNLPI